MKLLVAAVCLWGCLVRPSMPVRAAQPSSVESLPKWFWGCWIVKKELPLAPTAGIPPKLEKSVIGTGITFAPGRASWHGTVLMSPRYRVKVLSSDEFFNLNRFSLSEMGVKRGRVTEVTVDLPDHLSDEDFVGADSYLRERQKDIIIDIEEDTFVAEKAKPGDAACGCRLPKAK